MSAPNEQNQASVEDLPQVQGQVDAPDGTTAVPIPQDYVTPDDFASMEEYEAYVEAHPGSEVGSGAAIEVGLTGIKIAGDYWFIGVVLLLMPLLYFAKKKIDFYFRKKSAHL